MPSPASYFKKESVYFNAISLQRLLPLAIQEVVPFCFIYTTPPCFLFSCHPSRLYVATGGAQNVTVAVKIAAATQYTARRQSTLQA
jgi:hypothetical protein